MHGVFRSLLTRRLLIKGDTAMSIARRCGVLFAFFIVMVAGVGYSPASHATVIVFDVSACAADANSSACLSQMENAILDATAMCGYQRVQFDPNLYYGTAYSYPLSVGLKECAFPLLMSSGLSCDSYPIGCLYYGPTNAPPGHRSLLSDSNAGTPSALGAEHRDGSSVGHSMMSAFNSAPQVSDRNAGSMNNSNVPQISPMYAHADPAIENFYMSQDAGSTWNTWVIASKNVSVNFVDDSASFNADSPAGGDYNLGATDYNLGATDYNLGATDYNVGATDYNVGADSTNFGDYSSMSCSSGDSNNALCGGSVAEPINTATGNLTEQQNDYVGLGPLPLHFSRFYNSINSVSDLATTELGTNWRGTYDSAVTLLTDQSVPTVRVVRPSGQSLLFTNSFTDPTVQWVATDSSVMATLVSLVDSSGAIVGWRYTTREDMVETYDASGRLMSIADRAGLTQTLVYAASGTLTSVTDPFGRQLNFSYDAQNRLTQMVDPSGATYGYAYDVNNNLVSVTYPDGGIRKYVYENASYPNALTGLIDENGSRYATWTYDAQGLAISSSLAGGVQATTLGFNADGSTTVVDARGASRVHAFAQSAAGTLRPSGMTASCTNCPTVTNSIAYDTNGYLSAITDPNGNQVAYTYDARGQLISRTEAVGTPLARTVTISWHPVFHRPVQITYPDRVVTLTYDAAGNRTQKTVTAGSVTRTWTYTYSSQGLLTQVVGPRNDGLQYTYDTQGHVSSITNALGQVIQFTAYDANGRPLTVIDPNGVTIQFSYDARGRMLTRSAAGLTSRYQYDVAGQLIQTTAADGTVTTYGYDAAHRRTDITDAQGKRTHRVLNAAGDTLQTQLFDASNNLIRFRTYTFDGLGRVAQVTNANQQAVSFSRDNNGNVVSVTDPMSLQTQYSYDALNRLKQATDSTASTTQYGYDVHSHLTAVTDPRGLVTHYSYTSFGDPIQLQSPDTATTHFAQDAAGDLVQSTDARNRSGTNSYDAAGRLTQIAFSDQTLQFVYDQGTNGTGHLTHMADGSGTTQWTYSALGEPLTKQQTVGALTRSVSYGYNAVGQLTSLTTPSGQTIAYTYTNNRITGITVNGNTLLNQVTYAAFGPITGWSWGNGTATTRQYDTLGQLTAVSSAGTTTYTFNADSTIASKTDSTGGIPSVPTGNTSLTVSTTSNQLTASTGALTGTYSYDAAGNMTSDGTRTFTYNDAGRLSSVTRAGVTTNYLYNALGQRVKKSNSTGTTYFTYDEAGRLLGEYDQAGNLIQELVWLYGVPVATIRTDQSGGTVGVFYIHTDHLNAPAKITRPSDNQIIWRWDHDPFGNGAPNEDPDGNGQLLTFNLRFPGQNYDNETGLVQNGFRDYDPNTGRYVESDPIGLAGGSFSTYAYVRGNPLLRIDPFGRLSMAPSRTVSPVGKVIGDLATDLGAAAVLVICPECELTALALEVSGNVLIGGLDLAEGLSANSENQENMNNAMGDNQGSENSTTTAGNNDGACP